MFDFYLLIPYYNNPDGLIKSLRSVEYNRNACCILIIDDGSIIPLSVHNIPGDIVNNYKIRIIRLPQNKGIAEALNHGLSHIQKERNAELIARLDCGDICDPQRFYRQVEVFKQDSGLMLLGTWCRFKETTSSREYVYRAKTDHNEIVKQMHWKCSFIHPTVMFRRQVLDQLGGYPYEFPYAEDYAFFFKICLTFKTRILKEVLVITEIIPTGISVTKRKVQRLSIIKILNQFSKYKYLSLIGKSKQYLLFFMPESLLLLTKRFVQLPKLISDNNKYD